MEEREKNEKARKWEKLTRWEKEERERENLTSTRGGGREKRWERRGYQTPIGENLGISHPNEPEFNSI